MSPQKDRLLFLLELLNKETDEQHPMTVAEIISRMEQEGFSCCWNTLKSDMDKLDESGVDLICNKGRELQYFIGNRHFELAELKLLVDAVQASRFISAKKSKQLVKKLTELTSVHQAGELNRQLYIDKQPKTTNESVFYTVDLLHTAIREKKKVTFKYYEYDTNKKKVYKHNRQVYVFSPYALIWNSDCYYILGFSDSHGKIIKFRVDRIAKPEISDEPIVPAPKDFDPSVYIRSVFQMFDGAEQTVVLRCENALMKSIIDRFGEDVETAVLDDAHFSARVLVSASPTFFGWVFSFAGRMEITAPKSVADEYLALARRVAGKA